MALDTKTPHDPAWLELMYNNRALVPEHVNYFARWAKESAQVRADHPCVADLAYGKGARETLDVFPTTQLPPGSGKGRRGWGCSTAASGARETSGATAS